MNFEDIEVGMKARDNFGNQYEVIALEDDESYAYRVRVRCTTFSQSVQVDASTKFCAAGDAYWIPTNRKVMLNADNEAVQGILEVLGFDMELQQCITLTVEDNTGEVQKLFVYPAFEYECFQLTADELSFIPEVRPIKVADLRIGMKLVNANGVGYVLVGYDDKYVHLANMVARYPSLTNSEYVPVFTRQQLVDGALLGYTPAED